MGLATRRCRYDPRPPRSVCTRHRALTLPVLWAGRPKPPPAPRAHDAGANGPELPPGGQQHLPRAGHPVQDQGQGGVCCLPEVLEPALPPLLRELHPLHVYVRICPVEDPTAVPRRLCPRDPAARHLLLGHREFPCSEHARWARARAEEGHSNPQEVHRCPPRLRF